ncbi:hypothetical protein BT69DRAFT_565081 [Atractiella rhizophila]|nr:hypothetical protein BT69DRAFT_565081 [Atractiella rhizophila]
MSIPIPITLHLTHFPPPPSPPSPKTTTRLPPTTSLSSLRTSIPLPPEASFALRAGRCVTEEEERRDVWELLGWPERDAFWNTFGGEGEGERERDGAWEVEVWYPGEGMEEAFLATRRMDTTIPDKVTVKLCLDGKERMVEVEKDACVGELKRWVKEEVGGLENEQEVYFVMAGRVPVDDELLGLLMAGSECRVGDGFWGKSKV